MLGIARQSPRAVILTIFFPFFSDSVILVSGVSSMELRELEHPPQLWHNSKTSISVTTIVTHNRKLVATTNDKLTAL